jgi:hypothetical protein
MNMMAMAISTRHARPDEHGSGVYFNTPPSAR